MQKTKKFAQYRWWLNLAVVALIAAAFDAPANCRADAGTLLQWGTGDPGEGGPNPDEPIITDRPDFTESSVTVGRGVVQLEGGYTYFYDGDATGSEKVHSYPETLLRVGVLAEWLELRVGWSYLEETTTVFGQSRTVATGADDLYLGVKLALTGQAGLLPEMALVPQMRVPTGSDEFSADEVLPGLNWIYGWEINDWLSVGAQTQGNRRLDDETRQSYFEFSQSATVNYRMIERVGAYTEWFVFAPSGADSNHNEHYFDGGFTFLVTDNFQLDARAGVGLNAAAADTFAGLGFALRL